MSIIYNLYCNNCKVYIWIGQENYIYLDEKDTMKKLEKFLFRHKGHNLEFASEFKNELNNYYYSTENI